MSMGRKFIAAGRRRGLDVVIASYELHEHVPIACIGDVITGLKWTDPAILDDLHRVVLERRIDVMVPFVDMMVGVASRYVETYGDVSAPVSESALCDAMFDKVTADAIFERASIPRPRSYAKSRRPEFPLIAKPRYGSASKGIKIVRNTAGFREVTAVADAYLIQEYISHREEYTVDCYVDTVTGEPLCISPRLRLEVSGGEVSRTVTVDDPALVALTRDTLVATGLRGAVTVQFLHDLDTGRMLIMEVNPRLGGGAVCSVHAGCDIPGMIIDRAVGVPPRAVEPRSGVEIVRYFEEVVFDGIKN